MKTQSFFILLPAFILTACSSQPKKTGATGEPQHRIAYNVLANAETDDYEILSMNLDGSDKKNITNHPALAMGYRPSGAWRVNKVATYAGYPKQAPQ